MNERKVAEKRIFFDGSATGIPGVKEVSEVLRTNGLVDDTYGPIDNVNFRVDVGGRGKCEQSGRPYMDVTVYETGNSL